ncbi:MAG: 50S ribosomal protein L1 [Elusimicrobiota bacterium]
MSRSRRYKELREKIEEKKYSVDEAIKKLKELSTAKFDESIEVAIVLGVDPSKSDQMVRGSVVLPHGTGKEVRVAVAVEGKAVEEAKKAGADIAGKEKVIEKTKKGDIDFDILIATPDCMKDLGKFGRILGPKGLMPSPKSNTVIQGKDVAQAVNRVKKGQVEYKMDKNGVIHCIIGKVSFPENKIRDNYFTLMNAVKNSRPSSAKGKFVKKIAVSSTMGPSVKINI